MPFEVEPDPPSSEVPAKTSRRKAHKTKGGLGRRLGLVFLLQAAFISLAAMIGVYAAALTIEEVLIRRALEEEAIWFWERFARSNDFPLPDTLNLTGYMSDIRAEPEALDASVPTSIADLAPGFHDLPAAAGFSVVYVSQREGRTLFLVFDGERASDLAWWFGLVPLAGTLALLYLFTWLGYHQARRAISPIFWLARQVRRLDPMAPDPSTFDPQGLPPNADAEIRDLAAALERLSGRINEHIERERDFTRNASHELRTPLTVVRLAAGALKERIASSELAGDPQAGEALARIARAAHEMEETTGALLLLARASDRRLSSIQVDLNEIVDRQCDRAQSLLADRPIRIERYLGSPLTVAADPGVLSVLVGNLLRNAVQYTSKGTIEVRIEGEQLSIEDTGIGIAPEKLGSVFEPFVRAGEVASSVAALEKPEGIGQGHGVGLSIVKRLCDRFGWQVTLASRIGQGTCVRVDFSSTLSISDPIEDPLPASSDRASGI
ncbi:sensor histidine kinase [Thioalkalivibrio sp. HK1]|uniref:sensor histidine kinase n=1 Tax=Thioalkalivibrio sp. HK1 TaxID=1469245 RepID=UPI00046FFF25|nr:HAMP domain-containing sensor histidine kinase [Thioalkalivibrio sp. HK1]